MSFLSVTPDQIQSAAQDLAGIRSALSESSTAAVAPTTRVVAAAEDEVSTAIASIFGAYGRQYQVLSTQATSFHDEFVNLLNAGAGAYISTEVANARSNLLNAVNAPARELLGAGKLAAALQAAEPELAKAESEFTMAGQTALAGLAQLQPAVADLVHAGAAFVAAGTDAVAGLTSLESAATELAQGVGDIAAAAGSAASGLGLLGTAVGELLNPATIALAIPSAVGGIGLLGTAAVEFAQGVHELTLVGPDAVAGVTALQRASAEFAQGVEYVTMAEQVAAPGLATLQTAGAEFAQGIDDVQMAADAAAAVLRA
jgi:PE family